MDIPEKLIDTESILTFFASLSNGDAGKEALLKTEFVKELTHVQQLLRMEMDKKNWPGVKNVIIRIRTVFNLMDQKDICDFINEFPDVTSPSMNRVQKDAAVEKILQLLTYLSAHFYLRKTQV